MGCSTTLTLGFSDVVSKGATYNMGSYWSSMFTMYFQIDTFTNFQESKLIILVSLERADSVL